MPQANVLPLTAGRTPRRSPLFPDAAKRHPRGLQGWGADAVFGFCVSEDGSADIVARLSRETHKMLNT